MGDLKTRFTRNKSAAESSRSTATKTGSATTAVDSAAPSPHLPPLAARESSSLARLRKRDQQQQPASATASRTGSEAPVLAEEEAQASEEQSLANRRTEKLKLEEPQQTSRPSFTDLKLDERDLKRKPTLVLQEPTPDRLTERPGRDHLDVDTKQTSPAGSTLYPNSADDIEGLDKTTSLSPSRSASPRNRPDTVRRQSLVNVANAQIIKSTLRTNLSASRPNSPGGPVPVSATSVDYITPGLPTNIASMMHRKIWVRRPGASATLVQIRQDDLVDDVRDMILKKYANSLGRTFDPPDMTLRVMQRVEHGKAHAERTLGPEEEMCRTIDAYFPGGQMVEEALIIDVPHRRTPRPSPRISQHPSYEQVDDYRPMENGEDYFPPMPTIMPIMVPQTSGSHDSRASHPTEHLRSLSVLNTGQLRPLPSPGAAGRRYREHRPKYGRQHTSSPTIVQHPNSMSAVAVNQPILQIHPAHRPSVWPRLDSAISEHPHPTGILEPPALPTPPAPEAQFTSKNGSNPPTPSADATPHAHHPARPKKLKKPTPKQTRFDAAGAQNPNELSSGLLDSSVPPINVLIVEDNIINLKLLEAFMKRLKVRWSTAMNGQAACDKWRQGGFHLVLMDIQLPIMSGLEATKEIRRLERVNGIGVFSSSAATSSVEGKGVKRTGAGPRVGEGEGDTEERQEAHAKSEADEKLKMDDGLFKSPVIIVALTASSLQSDRHEALAAGCNDFLTKPVNFVWLERKVKEWGCMQALIDFDGWRQWKDFAITDAKVKEDAKAAAAAAAAKKKKGKRISSDATGLGPSRIGSGGAGAEEAQRGSEASNGTGTSTVEEEG